MQDEDIPYVEPVCPEEIECQPYLSGAEVEFYQAPRLGIIHLLAWATVALILMKCNLAMEAYQHDPTNASENYRIASKTLMYGSQIFSAAILVGGAVFWVDRLRKKSGANQPGHWILAIQSMLVPGYLVLWMIQSCYVGNAIQGVPPIQNVIYRVYTLFSFSAGVAFCVAAWRLPKYRLWKFYLGLIGMDAFSWSIFFLLMSISPYGMFLSFISDLAMYFRYGLCTYLVVLNTVDLFKGRRRDWMHWFGVAIPIVSILYNIGWRVAYALFYVPEMVR